MKKSREKWSSTDFESDMASINTERSKLAALAVHTEVRQPEPATLELDGKNLIQRMFATAVYTLRQGSAADRTILSNLNQYPDYQKHYEPTNQHSSADLKVAPITQPQRVQEPYDQDKEGNVTDITAFRKQADSQPTETADSIDEATIHNIAEHLR